MANRRNLQTLASCMTAAMILVSAVAYAQSVKPADKVLTWVADAAMPGPAVRFDYQSFVPSSGRRYIAHMNADQLVISNARDRKMIVNLDGFKRVHGVFAAPEVHRLYASVTGNHQAAAVDTQTLKIVGVAGPMTYPDGLAYAPKQKKGFVSDEHAA